MSPSAEPWFVAYLPPAFQHVGPGGLTYWQWVAVPALVVAAAVAGYVLERITLAVLEHLAKRTTATWDDVVVSKLGGPMRLGWATAVMGFVVPFLGLAEPAAATTQRLLNVVLLVVVFVVLWRLVTASDQLVSSSVWARMNPASRSLVPLAARVAKVLVVAVGLIAVLAQLGYPVASLVAGLGLGGLAFALAAQKTVENLFGAFSIGVDQPFREGDFVKIEGVSGTVESIGLRSTRIRTLDRTVVSLPNGKLADTRVETYAVRDRIKLGCTLALELGTSAAQVRRVVAGLEAVLRGHPLSWPDFTVRLSDFSESALQVEVLAWFRTTDWNEFTAVRQDVLLGFLEAVEAAGARLGRTSRLVELTQAPPSQTSLAGGSARG